MHPHPRDQATFARQGRQTLRSGLPSQGAHRRGRVVSRLRQESHPTREAAETRVAELNAHRHSHTTDPAEQRKRRARSLADWSADWLASQRVKVASGQLKAHARRVRPVAGPLRRAGAGHVPIVAVTPAQLEALIGESAADGKRRGGGDLHPKTVKHAWHVTRQVFRYAMLRGKSHPSIVPAARVQRWFLANLRRSTIVRDSSQVGREVHCGTA